MERGQVNGSFQRRAIAAGLFLTMSYGLIGNTLGFFVVPVTEGLGITRASFNLYYSILSIVSMITAPVYGRIYQTAPLKLAAQGRKPEKAAGQGQSEQAAGRPG